jgi:flagellar protein FliS
MHGQDEYLESQVMTASPFHLHLMVIDAAIRHAVRGQQAMAVDDFETTHLALNDSRGFIGELIAGLNEEQDPELIDRLKGLFLFAFRNLVEADLDRDATKIDDALKILRIHRETWLAVAEQLENELGEGTPADGPPRPHISQSVASDDAGQSWVS